MIAALPSPALPAPTACLPACSCGDWLLLGRKAAWAPARYSCLAGKSPFAAAAAWWHRFLVHIAFPSLLLAHCWCHCCFWRLCSSFCSYPNPAVY
jgi:hypothetical protein